MLSTFPLSTPRGKVPNGIAGVRIEKAAGAAPAGAGGGTSGENGGASAAAVAAGGGGLIRDAAFFRVMREGQVRGMGSTHIKWELREVEDLLN